jgi:septal ring factor EnvC (AmiA/AmiB activator)
MLVVVLRITETQSSSLCQHTPKFSIVSQAIKRKAVRCMFIHIFFACLNFTSRNLIPLNMANDYATERMNSAFAVLRTELNEMRSQDVQLMKQLLNINNSIQQLTKKQKCSKRRDRSQRSSFKEMTRASTLSKINEGNYTISC